MNRFAPNRPGGGGVGFALQIYCSAEVECTASGLEIDYSREPIIRHFAEVFKKTVHYEGGFKIAIQDHERKHVGLDLGLDQLNLVPLSCGGALDAPQLATWKLIPV